MSYNDEQPREKLSGKLLPDQCQQIIGNRCISWKGTLLLECNSNRLLVKKSGKSICLNENQKRLLACLFNNIGCKKKIINVVWYENHQRISDNNYHQLVFQLRATLQRNNLPSNLILTIPYYGLKLNESVVNILQEKKSEITATEKMIDVQQEKWVVALKKMGKKALILSLLALA
jgi:DNA-binding winged helix-turn-helix (wHTH) protein